MTEQTTEPSDFEKQEQTKRDAESRRNAEILADVLEERNAKKVKLGTMSNEAFLRWTRDNYGF